MNTQIDEIEDKKNELTKKFHAEIHYINEGLKLVEIDEISYAVKESILAEIEYGFNEKWKMYQKAMRKSDKQMPDKYYY